MGFLDGISGFFSNTENLFQNSDQKSDQPSMSVLNSVTGGAVHLARSAVVEGLSFIPGVGSYALLGKTFWSLYRGQYSESITNVEALISYLPFGALEQLATGAYSLFTGKSATTKKDVSRFEAALQMAFGAFGLACDVRGFKVSRLKLGEFLNRETARLLNPFHDLNFGRQFAGTGGMRESDLFGDEVEGVFKKLWKALSSSSARAPHVEFPDYLDREIIEGMYRTQDGKLVGRIFSLERFSSRDKIIIHFYEDAEVRGDIKIEYLTHGGKVSSWSDIEVKTPGNYHGFELYIQHLRASYKQGTIDQENLSARNVGRYLWSHLDGLKLEETSLENFREQMLSLSDSYHWGLTIDQLRRVNSPLGCSEAIVLNEAVPSLLPRVQRLFPHITDERIQLEMTRRPGRLVLMETRPGGGVIAERLPPYYEATLDFRDPEAMRNFERSVHQFWVSRGLAPRGTPVVTVS